MAKKAKRSYSEDITLTEYRDHTKAFNWFPGHMAKATKQVTNKLKMVDIVLEIRDARIPLLSGNEDLKRIIGTKSSLIVLNKMNLSNPEELKKWQAWFKENEQNYIFVNALDRKSIREIINKSKDIVHKVRLASGATSESVRKFRMMMVGLPNTGKSTLINALGGRKATKCGDKPGLTQSQQWIKLDGNIELLDTPGIMPRKIDTKEQGLWLCATHAIRDEILGQEEVACFIVEYLKKYYPEVLESRYLVKNLDRSVGEVIEEVALNRHFIRKKGEADFDRAFKAILSDFRKGELGLITFEKAPQ